MSVIGIAALITGGFMPLNVGFWMFARMSQSAASDARNHRAAFELERSATFWYRSFLALATLTLGFAIIALVTS